MLVMPGLTTVPIKLAIIASPYFLAHALLLKYGIAMNCMNVATANRFLIAPVFFHITKDSRCMLLHLLVFDLPTDYWNITLISNINQRNTRTCTFLSHIAVLATQSKESGNQQCR